MRNRHAVTWSENALNDILILAIEQKMYMLKVYYDMLNVCLFYYYVHKYDNNTAVQPRLTIS